jgi:hypothetical protein
MQDLYVSDVFYYVESAGRVFISLCSSSNYSNAFVARAHGSILLSRSRAYRFAVSPILSCIHLILAVAAN